MIQQGGDPEEQATIGLRKRIGFVDDKRMREPGNPIVLHGREVAEGKRVGQGPVLVEPLLIVAPLHVVEPARVAAVVSRIDPSLGVDLDAKRVATTFGKDLITARFGVISPDELAHRVVRLFTGIKPRTSDVAGDGRPLGRIKPAVGAPAKAVDDRVRIFQAEPLEMNFGVGIGHVVVIAIRVKEQIRRVEHPDAAPAASQRGDNVQAVEKRLVPVEDAVAVGVFVNRDLVLAAKVVGRRGRNLVVDGAPHTIVADHLQPGRIGILQVLNHPEPAALVERDRDGLPHDRLGQNQINLKIAGNLE